MPVVALLAIWLYIRGTRRLQARGRNWPIARTVCFCAGCLVVGAATLVSDRTFTAHMVEHILLGMIGPLLIATAAPLTLALQTGHPATRSLLRKVLHSHVVAVLTNPLVDWMLFGGTAFRQWTLPAARRS